MPCPPGIGSGSELQYMFMLDAMKTYPNFTGYMFMQEDVVVGFWNFPAKRDKSKVWRALHFPDPDVFTHHQNMSLQSTQNHSAVAKFWTQYALFPFTSVQKFAHGFSAEEQQRLFHRNSATGEESFRMAFSDFYYVPKKYRTAYITHMERAFDLGVFHEIALPIMFDAAVAENEFEELFGCALWQVTDPVQKISLYNPCWDFYHKIKSSNPREWNWYAEVISTYGYMMPRWNCPPSARKDLNSYSRVR